MLESLPSRLLLLVTKRHSLEFCSDSYVWNALLLTTLISLERIHFTAARLAYCFFISSR